MSDMAIDILLSLTAFCGCVVVGCFTGTCFRYDSPWWKYMKHSAEIGAVVGIVVAVVSYLWLSGYC